MAVCADVREKAAGPGNLSVVLQSDTKFGPFVQPLVASPPLEVLVIFVILVGDDL